MGSPPVAAGFRAKRAGGDAVSVTRVLLQDLGRQMHAREQRGGCWLHVRMARAERLSIGACRTCEPDLVHASRHEEPGNPQHLVSGKELRVRRQVHPFCWHAVLAPQVAPENTGAKQVTRVAEGSTCSRRHSR